QHRRGPEETDAEAGTLLVGPRDDLDRPPKIGARLEKRLHRLHGAEHAERAVEAATVRDRVDVRADEDRPTLAANTGEEVSGGIAPDRRATSGEPASDRSEEHTSELQSPYDLVCRLLLEKKKKNKHT